jgi:hypothetical protein
MRALPPLRIVNTIFNFIALNLRYKYKLKKMKKQKNVLN